MFSPLRCLQLAKAGSHVFADRSFKRRRACDVCKQNIDNPGAFCKGESASPSAQTAEPREKKKRTASDEHEDTLRPDSKELGLQC